MFLRGLVGAHRATRTKRERMGFGCVKPEKMVQNDLNVSQTSRGRPRPCFSLLVAFSIVLA